MKLNFTNHSNVQDMIIKMMSDKDLLNPETAIKSSVNETVYNSIEDYAQIALELWGHGDIRKTNYKLDNPVVDVDFTDEQINLINLVMNKHKRDIETAVSYFILFEMERLGHHI